MFKLFRISGNSLTPEYKTGDYILTATRFYRMNTGDRVVFNQDRIGVMVKIIDSISDDRQTMHVKGKHLHSFDGTIQRNNVIGKVIYHIKKNS